MGARGHDSRQPMFSVSCRVAARLALLIALAWSVCGTAEAQSCHTIALDRPSREPFLATVGLLYADFDTDTEAGNYEGLYASFRYQHPWFGAEVLLPAYRLDAGSGVELGVGDMVLTARGTALRLWDGEIALGVELPVMVPTGDEDRQLGMGHVMLMPGAWFSLSLAPFVLQAEVGYGRMLGSESAHQHHHHGGSRVGSPLVNPMNRSELEHVLTLGLGLRRDLVVHARWFGAVPIDDEMGLTRQVLAGGATATVDRFAVTAEVQVPVKGSPFDVKLVTQLGVRF